MSVTNSQPVPPTAATSQPSVAENSIESFAALPDGDLNTPEGAKLWYSDITDESALEWIKNKKLGNANDLAKTALGLAKKLGGERAGKLVAIPDENSPEEEVSAFRERLGVPKVADEYNFGVAEDASPMDIEFSSAMRSVFHEAGVPKSAAEKIAQTFNEYNNKLQEQFLEQAKENRQTVIDQWRKSQGINREVSEKTVEYGLQDLMPNMTQLERESVRDTLIDQFGARALDIFQKVGSMSEDRKLVVTHGTATTKQALLARKQQLMADGFDKHVQEIVELNKKILSAR
jgi:hypothetical protein